MTALRLYLFAGLATHKLVWELLKRRQRDAGTLGPSPGSPLVRLMKAAKIAILAGLVAQTMLPEVLQISTDPGLLRAAGVSVFTLGLAVAILGRLQLGENCSDIESAQVLGHQKVVASGPYRYIRHPIYAGDLLLIFGFELSLNSWLVLGVAALLPFVTQRAVREEKMLADALPGYARYCAHTKRFVPFVL